MLGIYKRALGSLACHWPGEAILRIVTHKKINIHKTKGSPVGALYP
jgi:hypothetical protein